MSRKPHAVRGGKKKKKTRKLTRKGKELENNFPPLRENSRFFFFFFSPFFGLLPHGVFYSWLSFAKYFLVGVVVLIVLTPVADNSILNFDREFMSLLLAGIFLGVSLILIIYKQLRRES